MALCGLSKKGQREQFVALSEQWWRISEVYQSFVCFFLFGAGFTIVRESSAVGGVDHVYRERLSALSARETLRPYVLRMSHSEKNPGRPYFACKKRLPCTFFGWADLELNLRCAPPPSGYFQCSTPFDCIKARMKTVFFFLVIFFNQSGHICVKESWLKSFY